MKTKTMACVLLTVLTYVAASRAQTQPVIYDDGGEHNCTSAVSSMEVRNGTTVNFLPGADVGYVEFYEGSVANVCEGAKVGDLWINNETTVGYIEKGARVHSPGVAGGVLHIYGGQISYLWPSRGTINIYGSGFEYNLDGGDWIPVSGDVPGVREGKLRGTLSSGESLDNPNYPGYGIPWENYGGTITVIEDDPSLEVLIDIKPGSYPNTINLGSNGVVPLAILSDEVFDATTVDPETVTLAGAGVAVRGKGKKYMAALDDVNSDGLPDLVAHVETENLDPEAFQDGFGVLDAATYDGLPIWGFDEITIVPLD